MSQEPSRIKLYQLHEEVKKKTYEQIIKEHYTDNWLDCTWLRRDYDAIRFHNFTEKDQNNPNLMFPCANSMKDLFEKYSPVQEAEHVFLSYHPHCTQPKPGVNIFALPSDKTIKAFEEILGPRHAYRASTGFNWSGLTSFSMTRYDDGTTIVFCHSGGTHHALAYVIDADETIKKLIGDDYVV